MTLKTIAQQLEEIRSKLDASDGPLGLRDAARFLGISHSYLYRLTSSDEIAHFKSAGGKKLYFRREDLNRWCLAHRIKTREELERGESQDGTTV